MHCAVAKLIFTRTAASALIDFVKSIFIFALFFGIQGFAIEPLKIDFQINQHDVNLKNIFPKGNSDKLCFPSALAHRLFYIKNRSDSDFPKLQLEKDPVANVEKFVRYCKTSQNGGTSQKNKIPCIERSFKEAGYESVKAFSIGEDSATEKRAVKVSDLTSAYQKGQAIILHIAWWKLDTKTNTWFESGSHSMNAYEAIVDPKTKVLKLKIVDPGTYYGKYFPDRMYDEVMVNQKGSELGSISQLELVSGRFHGEKRRALIKNIYVFGRR